MAESDPQRLSAILRSERARAGLTVRELADRAGLVPSTVSRLEGGGIAAPKPDHLHRLAQALGLDVEDLYAEAGYLIPGSLPGLRPYLRSKFGISDSGARQIEGYVQAVRDQTTTPTPKEGRHDEPGDQASEHA